MCSMVSQGSAPPLVARVEGRQISCASSFQQDHHQDSDRDELLLARRYQREGWLSPASRAACLRLQRSDRRLERIFSSASFSSTSSERSSASSPRVTPKSPVIASPKTEQMAPSCPTMAAIVDCQAMTARIDDGTLTLTAAGLKMLATELAAAHARSLDTCATLLPPAPVHSAHDVTVPPLQIPSRGRQRYWSGQLPNPLVWPSNATPVIKVGME